MVRRQILVHAEEINLVNEWMNTKNEKKTQACLFASKNV
jgi:hypothetical protein